MIRWLLFVIGVIVVLCGDVPAQKKRMSDVEQMMMVLNNAESRAIIRDSTLFVYVIKGNAKISNYRDCAEIAGANRLVLVSNGVVIEEKIQKVQWF